MATTHGTLPMTGFSSFVRRAAAVTAIGLLGAAPALAVAGQSSTAKPPVTGTKPAAPTNTPPGQPTKPPEPLVKPAVPATSKPAASNMKPPVMPVGVPTTPDYVIGSDDVLSVLFWREKEMSADVTVRPDGKVTLPLLNDLHAAGLTPDQLRESITKASAKFIEDPSVTVVVKEINSRRVFITGNVAKPGPYPLGGPTTVVQLIAIAGGVLEYADAENIVVMRIENGQPITHRFNYKDVSRLKNLKQNIELKPGDTIIVP